MTSPDAAAPPNPTIAIPAGPIAALFAGPAVKIGLIGLLLLIMLIPMSLVGDVITDREQYQEQALAGFRASWGPVQSVMGPILVVPYLIGTGVHEHREYLHIASSALSVAAQIHPEVRHRGLFHAVVYGAEAQLKGQFLVPEDALADRDGARPLWPEAFIVLGATDLRALKPDAQLSWNGKPLPLGDAGQHDNNACGGLFLMVAHPGLNAAPPPEVPIPFEAALALRGTEALRVVPIGRQIDMTMSGAWGTPSFVGNVPPAAYTLGDDRFEASWHVASNVETGRWVWTSTSAPDCANGSYSAMAPDAQIGTELLEAVPTYRMVERASKYGVLFLVLSFLTYFLFEMIARIRIHLVQYGLLGLSIALFALLLISFAEPLGFTIAYVLSSLAVMAQASVFTASVTRRPRLAAVFTVVLAALFAFLYIVLSLESFALLTGTVALFLVLSVVMALTRQIDWSSRRPAAPAGTAP